MNNLWRWTFINRTDSELTLECKDCGLLHTFSLSSLKPNTYYVCDTCGA